MNDKKSGDSGEWSKKHAKTLSGIESPINQSKRPDVADTIDQEKLLVAWGALVNVQKELVVATQKNLEDNERTRRNNTLTRTMTFICVSVVLGVAFFGKLEMNAVRSELTTTRADIVEMAQKNQELQKELEQTMRAMRATSGALNTFLEKQSIDDESQRAALEAHEVTLEVSAEVEDDPKQRKNINQELRKVRMKKAAMSEAPPATTPTE